jgi:hypothetical protein
MFSWFPLLFDSTHTDPKLLNDVRSGSGLVCGLRDSSETYQHNTPQFGLFLDDCDVLFYARAARQSLSE